MVHTLCLDQITCSGLFSQDLGCTHSARTIFTDIYSILCTSLCTLVLSTSLCTLQIWANSSISSPNSSSLSKHSEPYQPITGLNPISHGVKQVPLSHGGGAIMTMGFRKYFLLYFWLFLAIFTGKWANSQKYPRRAYHRNPKFLIGSQA